MATHARSLTPPEVAARIGRSPDWFYRNWRGMVRRGELPPPLPGPGRKRWSSSAIDAWLAPADPELARRDERRDRLAQRAAQLAAGIAAE